MFFDCSVKVLFFLFVKVLGLFKWVYQPNIFTIHSGNGMGTAMPSSFWIDSLWFIGSLKGGVGTKVDWEAHNSSSYWRRLALASTMIDWRASNKVAIQVEHYAFSSSVNTLSVWTILKVTCKEWTQHVNNSFKLKVD